MLDRARTLSDGITGVSVGDGITDVVNAVSTGSTRVSLLVAVGEIAVLDCKL